MEITILGANEKAITFNREVRSMARRMFTVLAKNTVVSSACRSALGTAEHVWTEDFAL